MRTEVEGLADRLERWAGVIQARDEAVEVMHEAAAALRAQAERVRVLETAADRLVEATCPIGTAPSEAQLIELSDAALAVAALLAATQAEGEK